MGPPIVRPLPLRVVPLPLATSQHQTDLETDINCSRYASSSLHLQQRKAHTPEGGSSCLAYAIVDPPTLAQEKNLPVNCLQALLGLHLA